MHLERTGHRPHHGVAVVLYVALIAREHARLDRDVSVDRPIVGVAHAQCVVSARASASPHPIRGDRIGEPATSSSTVKILREKLTIDMRGVDEPDGRPGEQDFEITFEASPDVIPLGQVRGYGVDYELSGAQGWAAVGPLELNLIAPMAGLSSSALRA